MQTLKRLIPNDVLRFSLIGGALAAVVLLACPIDEAFARRLYRRRR